jgi:AcrR family transcriptional regulator
VPSNRRDIPRADRINAILDVATRLFLERGFSETTVADVARQAGVRNGTVHWYFASKDDLLAAVILRTVDREYARAMDAPDATPRERLIMFLSDLRPFRELNGNVRDRARVSETVHDAQRQIGKKTRSLMAEVLTTGESWCDPDIATDILLAAFEGNNLMQQPRMSATEMIVFLLDNVFLGPKPLGGSTAPAVRSDTPIDA